jgi:cytosine deaminase
MPAPPAAPGRVYRNARLRGRAGLADLHVAGGRIERIEPASPVPASPVPGAPVPDFADLRGALVLPPLVEAHLHLEKAYLLDRMPREATSLADAIALTSALKTTFTRSDMRRRALRLVRAAMSRGVTALRAHVEIDDILGLRAVEAILGLREELRGLVDIQVVAFPQEGLTSQRTAVRLLRDALALGADVVGGIPYADDDAAAHLDLVFSLAEAAGRPVDLHIDLSDDPARLDVVGAAERTDARGLQGRVTVGHLTSLGSAEPATAAAVAAQLARAEISVVALPATDVYLGGRGDASAPRRGLTPVRLLLAAGVNVAVATNNVQNAFTPFGRGSILDTAVLLAALCHFGSAADAELVTDMMTTRAARAIGLDGYGIAAGGPADFAAYPAESVRGLLGDVERPVLIVKGGRPVEAEEIPDE